MLWGPSRRLFTSFCAIHDFVSRFERTLFRVVRKFSLISFISEMSILNYFQKAPKTPLQGMSSAPTEEDRMDVVNLTARETEEVTKEFTVLENKGTKRGKYIKWSAEERAEIGQHAVRHAVNQTVRLLKGKYPLLTKQTVSDFKKAFIQTKQTTDGKLNRV